MRQSMEYRHSEQRYQHSSNASAESDRKETSLLLHPDYLRPHYSAQTQGIMGKLKFTMVPQPSYSPDLAPSDIWLFLKLKKTLKAQRFSTDTDASVRKWIRSQPESFMDGI
ncbi:hypothetical protein TNCV_5081181 [Trichonephila clavipes]|nr:hypothetical protein TNCV_5081181 [Trichonephila clavipes]